MSLSVLLVVLFFVLLGLAVLYVALRGGRKKEARLRHSQTRRNSRLGMAAFALALVGLGIGIPAAVIGAVGARDSIPESNIANLTAAEKEGRKIFGQHCKNCHALDASNAVAEVGPNMDKLRPPKALVIDAVENGRARGNGQMAADLVEGKDVENVAAYLAKATGSAR